MACAALAGCLDAPPQSVADGGPAGADAALFPGQDGGYGGWTRRTTITIAGTNKPVDDVPVLVYLTPELQQELALADDLHDLRFVDGVKILAHDVVAPNAAGDATIYVGLDQLPGAGTTFFVYGGNPDAPDGENAPDVWKTFSAVWHLDGATDDVFADETGYHPGTAKGGTPEVSAGWTGNAAKIDGAKAIQVEDDPHLSPTDAVTVEIAVRPDVVDFTTRRGVRAGGFELILSDNDDRTPSFLLWEPGGVLGHSVVGSTIPPMGQWLYLVGSYDRSLHALYQNGAADIVVNQTTALDDNDDPLFIGQGILGDVDEVRISPVARSGEWIDLQYRMRALGNDIVSIGTVEDLTQ